MTPIVVDGNLTRLENHAVSVAPEYTLATQALATGKVPEDKIKTHVGKGGKVFSYVSHIDVTTKLRVAIGPLWGMRVRDPKVLSDGSAMSIVGLELYMPLENGTFLVRTIEEIGAFDGGGGKMPHAMMIASAVSRGLCKCVMRAFGYGAELYEEEDDLTPGKAWAALENYIKTYGVDREQYIQALRNAGFKNLAEELLNKFQEAWRILADLAGKKSGSEAEVPDLSTEKTASAPQSGVADNEDYTEAKTLTGVLVNALGPEHLLPLISKYTAAIKKGGKKSDLETMQLALRAANYRWAHILEERLSQKQREDLIAYLSQFDQHSEYTKKVLDALKEQTE